METLINFRDLGDIPVADGKKIKPKKILRAGEPVKLSDTAINFLKKDCNISKVVDFRSTKECEERPNDIIEGTEYIHIDIMKSIEHNKTSMDEFIKNTTSENVKTDMTNTYKDIILNLEAQQSYRKFINVLLNNEEGSVLFHCFAGKDRTGIGAMLVLEILGADREDIFIDFLKTNELRITANRAIIETVKEYGYSEEELDALKTSLNVDRSYLEAVYDTICKEYESVEQYIENVLKISQEDVDKLKEIYLV
jgi:Protein tyrosine/serine phosphatase